MFHLRRACPRREGSPHQEEHEHEEDRLTDPSLGGDDSKIVNNQEEPCSMLLTQHIVGSSHCCCGHAAPPVGSTGDSDGPGRVDEHISAARAPASQQVPVLRVYRDESVCVLDIDLKPELATWLLGQLPQDSFDVGGYWLAVLVPHLDVLVDRHPVSPVEQHPG